MIKAALSAGVVAVLAIVMLVSRAPQNAEAATLFVFNPGDEGFGTLRWAVGQANGNPGVDRIVVKTTVPITLYSPVVYYGPQTLMVQGDHALHYRVIQGTLGDFGAQQGDGCALFESVGGADITFYQLVFRDSWCNGIAVYGESGDGEIVVTLNKTIVEDNAWHGVYLSEGGGGSTAAFKLNVMSSFIRNNGQCEEYCYTDYETFDGVHISEYGDGNVTATCTGSSFTGNSGDGLEIDEEDSGNVTLTSTNCQYNDNGDGMMESVSAEAEDDLEAAGGYDSRDGLHVREDGTGNVTVTLNTPNGASNNWDDGVDVKEEDGGDLAVTATGLTADGNDDGDGLRAREYDTGKLTVKLTNTRTWNNYGNGVDAQEAGDGDLSFEATGSSANFNGDDGFDVVEEDAGKLTGKFSTIVANANGDDGLDVAEYGTGAYAVTIYTSTVQGNGEFAVEGSADIETGTIAFGTSTILGGIDLMNINVIP